MENYYFEYDDSEFCYTKEYFEDHMRENDLKEIEVFEACRDKMDGIFWCKEHYFCGDDSKDTCGRQCDEYEPRNKISGCCRHYSTRLYVHGNKITLKP